jgi:hypothetical protein
MELAMCRWFSWILCLLAVLVTVAACHPRVLPAVPAAGVPLQPGRYVNESYFAPDFKPAQITYSFNAFPVTQATNAPEQAFQKIFQEELIRAWQDQGLKIASGKEAGRVSGTIHRLLVRGARFRWLTGRLYASLSISGTITRGSQVLFAFRDQVYMASPVAPGRAAPREKDLLLRHLAQEAAHRILNELLLHGPPTAESG